MGPKNVSWIQSRWSFPLHIMSDTGNSKASEHVCSKIRRAQSSAPGPGLNAFAFGSNELFETRRHQISNRRLGIRHGPLTMTSGSYQQGFEDKTFLFVVLHKNSPWIAMEMPPQPTNAKSIEPSSLTL